MCILVLAWRDRPGDRLVLLANRDEFHARGSAAAAWWDDVPAVLGGRDLVAGGTWLGVTRSGRFAVVTNLREPRPATPLRSRGRLVSDFLRGEARPAAYAEGSSAAGADYAGFNLICGDRDEIWYASNRAAPRPLAAGVHALSNATLDQPWPKVERLRARFDAARAAGDDALLELLRDRTPADDLDLPATGVGLEHERLLSSAFVVSPAYGTRASSLLTISDAGAARFRERSFGADGRAHGNRLYAFRTTA